MDLASASKKESPVQDLYRVENPDLDLGFGSMDPDQDIEEIYRDDLDFRGREGSFLDDNDFGGPMTFPTRPDEQFCEVTPPAGRPARRDLLADWAGSRSEVRNLTPGRRGEDEAVFYSPDRGPPIRDFFTVMTAFLVAVFAAYYSIVE